MRLLQKPSAKIPSIYFDAESKDPLPQNVRTERGFGFMTPWFQPIGRPDPWAYYLAKSQEQRQHQLRESKVHIFRAL